MDPWPTNIPVRDSADPVMAGAALSLGLGGLQTRNIADIGWVWSEIYADFSVRTIAGRAFMNRIARAWNEGEIFTKLHPELKTPLGAGAAGFSPKINGANQRGTSINSDGWPLNTLVLREGDPIRIGTLRGVFRVRQDITSNGSGQAVLKLNPLIVVGSEPLDNDDITWTGVPFHCVLGEPPDFASARSNAAGFIRGLTLVFYEALS